jgi:hypothetical protein
MAGIAQVAPTRWEHGTRARYVAGKCRCDDCRRANREYAQQAALRKARGGADPLVSADAARAHLLDLAKADVGRRAVSAASDVSETVLQDVRSGRKTQIRRSTEKRILAVDASARSDHSRVPAGPTNAALKKLRKLGMTKTAISERLLGRRHPTQLGGTKLVLASTAHAVERLLREQLESVETENALCGFCEECDAKHTRAKRQRILRHAEDRTPERLLEDWPHSWPSTPAGWALLKRDLATLVRGKTLRDADE